MKRSYKLALSGILATLTLVSFVIENLFPPIIFAGARIGVSNIFVLLSLIMLGEGYAFATLIIKTVLGSLFAGNISMLMYSLPSGAVALMVEILLLRLVKSGVVSTSTAGAVINTVCQNLMFCLITDTVEVLYYLPYLALIATLSGVTVGLATFLIIKRLPQKLFDKKEKLKNGEESCEN